MCITILSKIDFLTVPKSFVGEPFFIRNLLLSKIFMDRKGISRFSLELFLSHSTEKIPSLTLLSEKNSGLKKLNKMVYHDFVGNWFSQTTEKLRRGTLLFSESFLYRKSFWIGGGNHDFFSKLFCLTVPKTFLGGHFFQKISGLRKLHKRCITTLSKIDSLTVQQDFVGDSCSFHKKFFYRKFLWLGGGYHDFL